MKRTSKKVNDLDMKIREINEKHQKLMKPATVTKRDKAFKGPVRSCEDTITNERDPLMHLNGSNKAIESRLKELQVEMKMYKLYGTTMKVTFKKPQGDNTLYKPTLTANCKSS